MTLKDEFNKDEALVLSYLDKNAQASRIAAWVICVLNAINGVMTLMAANITGAVLSIATAIIILWMLVKTKAPSQVA